MEASIREKKILIVGGTGFIGRHLAVRCLKDTHFVTCIGLSAGKSFSKDMEFIHADISDKKQLQAVLRDKSFDYVFNLGGYIDHTAYFKGGRRLIESHFIGLMNLIDCLNKEELKGFVQIGSSDEYGNAPAPQKEYMRESPISPYSFAKTAASHFIQMLSNTEGFPGVVLRLFLVYGPGQDEKRFLPQIITAFLRNESVETTGGKQLRDFCYIDDVIDGIIKAAVTDGANGKIINIASGIPMSIRDMINKVAHLIGKGRAVFGARPYRHGENMELFADITSARKTLQWSPSVSVDEGLRKTIEYYKNQQL
ncbi:MAG: NAD-dependent epimerase/dehydratase family protein [Nitrospirae bacterium]|nr:NAD-dependent epimerase/dehydratase family protein [Nitrospirota bacterium]